MAAFVSHCSVSNGSVTPEHTQCYMTAGAVAPQPFGDMQFADQLVLARSHRPCEAGGSREPG